MSEEFKKLYDFESSLNINQEWKQISDRLDKKKRKRRFIWIFFLGLIGIVFTAILKPQFLSLKSNELEIAVDNSDKELPKGLLNTSKEKTASKSEIKEHLGDVESEYNALNGNLEPLQVTNNRIDVSSDYSDFTTINLETQNAINDEPMEMPFKVIENLTYQSHNWYAAFPIIIAPMLNQESLPIKNDELEIDADYISTKSTQDISKYNLAYSLGVHALVGVFDRNLKNKSSNDSYIKLRRDSETAMEQIGTSLSFKVNLNKKWYLRTGLEYYRSTEKLRFKGQREILVKEDNPALYTDKYGNSSLVNVTSETLNKYDINILKYNYLHQISVPISVGYEFGLTEKFKIGLESGIQIPLYQSYDGVVLGEKEPLENINRSTFVKSNKPLIHHGLNFTYNVHNDFNIHFGLYNRYDLSTRISQSDIEQCYRSYLLSIGVSKRI